MKLIGSYPSTRLRRNRKTEWSRRLVSENNLSPSDLIWPIFLTDGKNQKNQISTMPGVYRYSVDKLEKVVEKALKLKLQLLALFPYTHEKFKDKKPDELSGGEAQRLMIAFVLSKNPSFLIADESTTGLDVTRQKTIIDLFHKIRKENSELTMIIISHDFGVLDHLVDSYIVMYGGFLCEYIKDKKRITKLKELHPYSRDLIMRLN